MTQHPESEWLDDINLFIGTVDGKPKTIKLVDYPTAKSKILAKLKLAEERAYKQGWDSAGGEAMEETHQKELKSAEIEGREAELNLISQNAEDWTESTEYAVRANVRQRLNQLKTIKEQK